MLTLPWDELQNRGTSVSKNRTGVIVNRQQTQWSRRLFEAGFFAALIGLLWTVDTMTQARFLVVDDDYSRFRLYVSQATSAAAAFLLVPAVAWWLTKFPLQRDRVFSSLIGHAIGTVLFAVAHYFGMVAFRYVVYTTLGQSFVFSDYWVANLIVEHQKDIKIYLGIVAIITGYSYYRSQEADAVQTRPDRLIVQTGSGEAIIRQENIEYLEAARNYVVVGTSDREYLVRETLGNLEKSLAPDHIVRTHRSYLVNLDRVVEIRATGSSGHEILLQGGKRVPLSRGYRDQFKLSVADVRTGTRQSRHSRT